MALTTNNRDDWEDVFDQAVALRDIEPWNIMEESEIFGIKSLYHDEIGWCYFIGNSGEVFALIIAIGDEGLASYYGMRDPRNQEAGLAENLFRFFNQRIIKIEFTIPIELDKQDRMMHKIFKVPTKGDYQHCLFRSYLPGYPEALPKDDLLPFLADCLEQALHVAQAYGEDETIIYGPKTEDYAGTILVRSSKEVGEDVVWKDEYLERFYPEFIVSVDRTNLAETLKTELAGLELQEKQYYYFMRYSRRTVKRDAKGGPEYRPIMSCFLSPKTAYAHPPELFHYKWLPTTFTKRFCRQLKAIGFIPRMLYVNTTFMAKLVLPIAEILGMEVGWAPNAPEFEEFEDGITTQF